MAIHQVKKLKPHIVYCTSIYTMCVITGKLRVVYEVRMHVYSYTAFFWYISYKFCRQIMIRGGAGRGYAPSNQARPPRLI